MSNDTDTYQSIIKFLANHIKTEGVNAAQSVVDALSEASIVAGLSSNEWADHAEHAAMLFSTEAQAARS